jgi:hypothetical protein
VLLWFSKRSSEYEEGYRSVAELYGEFPHLVNLQMIEGLRPECQAYAEVVSSRGLPQVLRNRHTGEKVAMFPHNREPHVNNYYASPEMQVDAADVLEPRVREVLKGAGIPC